MWQKLLLVAVCLAVACSAKKKSLQDMTDAEIEAIYDQWEVSLHVLKLLSSPIDIDCRRTTRTSWRRTSCQSGSESKSRPE